MFTVMAHFAKLESAVTVTVIPKLVYGDGTCDVLRYYHLLPGCLPGCSGLHLAQRVCAGSHYVCNNDLDSVRSDDSFTMQDRPTNMEENANDAG